MNRERQFDTNDDPPQYDSGAQDAGNFPDTVITDCHSYQGNIYNEDGSIFTDENGVSVFAIVVPYLDNIPFDEIGDSDSEDEDMHISERSDMSSIREPADYAYWSVRELRVAIYGGVFEGKLLRKMPTSDGSVKWIRTPTKVAIKKLDYDRVIRDADNSAERPMEEIKAMQYLQRHIADRNNTLHDALTGEEVRARAEQGIMENNIMTSIDVLTDNVYLYLIMPFCDGRELFDVVQAGKFSEPEARHWFKQILKAVETLQEAGVCHRDMSLENIMTSGNDLAIVIDFGMCLKIPYITDEYGNRQRCLIKPDRACGKDYYMSPEIRQNRQPFDAHAIDMWALGPILFMMVCGFSPWDKASPNDNRFRAFYNGQCVQLATHWNLGLSPDLMDLLQRMFWMNPKNRLSLGQVRDHPWMNGPVAQPTLPENIG